MTWRRFLDGIGLGASQEVIVAQPSAVTAIARLIGAAPLGVLKDQLLVRSLNNYAAYLPAAFDQEQFAFYGTTLSGTPEQEVRWKRAVSFTTGALADDVSKLYVERHFPPETKAAADTLVKNVVAAMGRRIDGLAWMAPETKVRARAKLAGFVTKIGYPDRWQDYSALEIRAGRRARQCHARRRMGHADAVSKLGGPIRRWEWGMTPMTINAYANFGMKEIVFPAAILQPPFFDPNADPAINYGGIGAVIGHEISHHFDDQGAKYDENGRLADWWTPADVKAFDAATKTLVTQYDAYEVFPGAKVKGAFTLGENIGDLAGLTVAYDAYRTSLGGAEPPVIDGTSGDAALLPWLGAGVAPQLSRGQSSPAPADRSALAVRAARRGRSQPRPLVLRLSRSSPGRSFTLRRPSGCVSGRECFTSSSPRLINEPLEGGLRWLVPTLVALAAASGAALVLHHRASRCSPGCSLPAASRCIVAAFAIDRRATRPAAINTLIVPDHALVSGALDLVADPVALTRGDGQLVTINQAFAARFGEHRPDRGDRRRSRRWPSAWRCCAARRGATAARAPTRSRFSGGDLDLSVHPRGQQRRPAAMAFRVVARPDLLTIAAKRIAGMTGERLAAAGVMAALVDDDGALLAANKPFADRAIGRVRAARPRPALHRPRAHHRRRAAPPPRRGRSGAPAARGPCPARSRARRRRGDAADVRPAGKCQPRHLDQRPGVARNPADRACPGRPRRALPDDEQGVPRRRRDRRRRQPDLSRRPRRQGGQGRGRRRGAAQCARPGDVGRSSRSASSATAASPSR